ncbi:MULTISPECIES: tetratricopeptide repeat protein [Bacteroides]|uniref:tetratricopeptide repeat protein n=1 Tax=Bacteroides TaxID=816 RepID=UPI001C37D128|nr:MULTISPECIES: tetratricopeptide repeat protein [Bacteroides]MBV3833623.1 tetratricopeptide repeat protein [Bacteroides xylanisolvens]MBV3876634.1 tetratricopeptide repeat protein [Bacteroides xylanisolvens]MBV3881923.1 tetratricopeptide repeat protein [Bacteroides xylanisolvens]MBV3907956.1 tetratricopeptide repeat protein [Bacteroides xylanisolvens]MBV3913523.1 tetratricopeptide repeat protein [Bacteroides xylanisolvens]
MKNSIGIIIISILVLSGCNKQSMSDSLLNEVEKVIAVNPDSASNLLKSISSPEKLDDKTFARWCMLSGKITDEIFNSILPTYQLERAYEWYSSHGSPDEQVQILIYLGRSFFADGDYDKAMSIYTNALDIAEKNKLNNLTGYTYSYIGDLYGEKFMRTEAIKRYKAAAECFKKENNTDSYACALRDVGREYACIDSLSRALKILTIADSVARNTKNIEVTASIDNALGNIYAMQNKYDKAEEYFLKALVGRETMPDYMALIDLYIASGAINKAKELLSKIPQDNPKYTYSIKYLYYQIYNEEKNYKEALTNLKEYIEITDSIIYADNQSKILNIESKYNHLKISKEIDRLKIKQQSYIIVLAICIGILLLIIIGYLLYRKKAKEKIQRQQEELNRIKTDLLYVSLELEKKKRLLDTFKEKNESYDEMQEEISLLTTNYKQLQSKILENSPLHKELIHLANQNKPRNNKPLIADKQWKLIADEITYIYPNLRKYIYSRCPNLPEQDFWYCCLYISGFDTNTEAKLLNITVDSVRKKRLRLRQKLNIILPDNNATLYEYLIENMH